MIDKERRKLMEESIDRQIEEIDNDIKDKSKFKINERAKDLIFVNSEEGE